MIFTKWNEVDIDHVVPLHFAHLHGSSNWTRAKRVQFANDYENLLITEKGLNRQKSSMPPWEWIPLRKDLACRYKKRWFRIIDKYKIKLTPSEISKLSKSVKGSS